MIPTLILAAGTSSRMKGRDKLLEELDGTPLLEVLARRALAVGPVYVTLRTGDHARRFALLKAAQVVTVEDADKGMAHSIRAGIAALPDACAGVMILPADMPEITSDDLTLIKTRALDAKPRVVRATTEDGTPGHPIYFAASEFPTFDTLHGDRGAFALCEALSDQTEFVALGGNRARLDLDTPEDWETYRLGLSS